jgi:hypothetical protein
MKENLTNLSGIFMNSVQDLGGCILYFCFSDEAQAKSLRGKTKPQITLIESFVISKFGGELCSKSYEKLPIIPLG